MAAVLVCDNTRLSPTPCVPCDRHQPTTDGLPPCPRDQCSATIVGSKLVLFGGRTYGSRLCDLWTFDLDSFTWEQCAAAGTVPPPRQAAALAADADGQLWVHGGAGHFILNDCYRYDFDAEEWSVVPVEGRVCPARVGHILTFHSDGELRLFGGLDELGGYNWVMFRLARRGAKRWVRWELLLGLGWGCCWGLRACMDPGCIFLGAGLREGCPGCLFRNCVLLCLGFSGAAGIHAL